MQYRLFYQVKEDVFLKFQERMKDENLATCLIAKQVLLDTLHIISSSLNGSQDTLKLESSEDKYMPTNEGTGSGSTVRVDSNGIEINIGLFSYTFLINETNFFPYVYCFNNYLCAVRSKSREQENEKKLTGVHKFNTSQNSGAR